MIELVKEFQDAFQVECPSTPTLPHAGKVSNSIGEMHWSMKALSLEAHALAKYYAEAGTMPLRLHLLQEELAELAEAMANGDLVATLDALVDLQYVLSGTVLSLGFASVFEQAFKEVHRSNMSKLEDGKPLKNDAGRVVKGKNYSPPNLEQFV
jgi:predicted HAD superfamily Cof-like phosphohydrolase